jgi:O-antigen/teichoic acid export membrane protein
MTPGPARGGSFSSLKAITNRLGLGRLLPQILGDSLISFGSKIAGAGLTFIMLVVFSRLMTPDQFGHFGLAMNAAILLSTLVGLGLPVAVMRFYPSHVAKNELSLAKGFLAGGYRAVLMAAAVSILVALCFSYFNVFGEITGSRGAPTLIALLALFIALSDYAAGALRAQSHIAWSALPRDLGWRISAPLIAIAAVLSGIAMPNSVALAICIATLGIITVIQVRKSLASLSAQTLSVQAQTKWSSWRTPLLPLWFASILFAMIQQADVIVVGSLLGAEQAGAYFAAQKTAALLGLAMIAGGQVAAPMMASAYHSKNIAELRRICRMLAAAIALVTFLGLVFVVIFGTTLLSIFSPAYVSAYPVLVLFALSATVDAICGPTAYLMQMTSLEKAYLKIMAGCYTLVLVSQVIFVPRYGLVAAAICTGVGVILWNLIAIVLLRRKIGVDPSVFSFFRSEARRSP